jgi:hypothetical protein
MKQAVDGNAPWKRIHHHQVMRSCLTLDRLCDQIDIRLSVADLLRGIFLPFERFPKVQYPEFLMFFLLLVIVALPGTAMSRAVPFKTIDKGEMSYYLYTGL